MANEIDRRDLLKLTAIGGLGVVFASALPGMAHAAGQGDFYFVQLSDTHWGFEGPPNPDAKDTLKKAVAAVNSLEREPDFISPARSSRQRSLPCVPRWLPQAFRNKTGSTGCWTSTRKTSTSTPRTPIYPPPPQ